MILITGATGLVGGYLLKLLESDDRFDPKQIKIFARETSDVTKIQNKGYRICCGDITDRAALAAACKGVDVMIHIVQMRYAPIVVDVANECGVKRSIIVGTTGVFSKYNMYSNEYKKAEQYIVEHAKSSYVVLRPTMIYGDYLDKNMHKLLIFMKRFGFFPIFGSGQSLMQPIYYQDVAQALYKVLQTTEIHNQFINIAGKNAMPYHQILKIAATKLNKKVWIMKIPYKVTEFIVRCYNKITSNPMIRLEQVHRLNEDKAFSNETACKLFGFEPTDFATGIKNEIEALQLKGML